MLRDAGYANERLVLLHASDFAPVDAMWQVISVRLREAGFNVDDQVMDQATVIARRNNREAPEKGGWSLLDRQRTRSGSPQSDGRIRVAYRRGCLDRLANRSSSGGAKGKVDR